MHHLALEPASLKHFSRGWARRTSDRPYITRYKRPARGVFEAHARREIERWALEGSWIRGTAKRLGRCKAPGGGWRVTTGTGEITADRVLLALGSGDRCRWPEWARSAPPAARRRIIHVLDTRADWREPENGRVVVVGGGSSAIQLANRLARVVDSVTVLSRRSPGISHFDADQGWMGPKRLTAYHREADMARRRSLIRQGRRPGTVPPEVAALHKHLCRSGRLRHHVGDAVAAVPSGRAVSLELADGTRLEADRVLLAAGYGTEVPGGDLVADLVEAEGLPVAPCGYPVPGKDLQWGPGLFVSGPLAELEIGPVSRNIHGARLAAARLAGLT